MAIIIPSKNIYNKENPKIIDNVIERVEVSAVEVVPSNEYNTSVYNEKIQYVEQNVNISQEDFDSYYEIYRGFPTGGEFVYGEAIVYSQITGIYFSGTIKIQKISGNQFIQKIYTSTSKRTDSNGKEIIESDVKYTSSCLKKVGTLSVKGQIAGSVSDGILKSDISIDKSTIEREFNTNDTASMEQLTLPIKAQNKVTKSHTFRDYDGNTYKMTISKDLDFEFNDTKTNLNSLNVTEEKIGNKEYYVFDFQVLCGAIIDNARYTNFMEGEGDEGREIQLVGETTNYIPQSIVITVNGDTIGIDLVDKTVYINGETAKKNHSVEGNELMQTTNYTPLYKYENIGDIQFTGRSIQLDEYLSLEITTSLKLSVGDTFYYKEDSIFVVSKTTENGWETFVKYGGAIEKAFKENSSQTITISKKITEEQLNIVPKFKETQKLYEKGKETATVLCSISDYYEYGTLSKKIISIDNSTNKMMFEVGDEVIPMVYSSSGVDVPMSVYNDKEKTFIVVGCRIYYDGAIWQELSLQEYHVIQFNATEGLTYDYSSTFDGYVCTGIGTATDTDIVIDSTYNGFTIRGIDASAFEGELLTSVRIPDTVIRIGSSAFEGCTSLSIINIGNSVETINIDAFYNTRYYNNENNWENGVVLYIGEYLIKAKTTLSGEYTIKDGTLCIADYAFDSLQNLRGVNMPDSLRSIGTSAFEGSDGIGGQIKIPNSVKLIGERAFYGLGDVESVKMSSSLRYIGADAFYNCVNLMDVHVDSIASWCNIEFENMYANPLCHKAYLFLDGILLSNLIIPRSVQYITKYAFYSSPSPVHVDTGLVVEIGDYAFYDCNSLTSVVLNNVRRIGQNAFYGTSLNKVYYKGIKSDWDAALRDIESGNDKLKNATRYYYSETKPTQGGNWWHYVDEIPTIWNI